MGTADNNPVKIGLAVARYYEDIAQKLADECTAELARLGVLGVDITTLYTNGSYELPLVAQWLARDNDAVIAIGVVVKGQTDHNRHIAGAVVNGLTQVALKTEKPVILGVLTVNNLDQAHDRVKRATDWAKTAVAMANIRREFNP